MSDANYTLLLALQRQLSALGARLAQQSYTRHYDERGAMGYEWYPRGVYCYAHRAQLHVGLLEDAAGPSAQFDATQLCAAALNLERLCNEI